MAPRGAIQLRDGRPLCPDHAAVLAGSLLAMVLDSARDVESWRVKTFLYPHAAAEQAGKPGPTLSNAISEFALPAQYRRISNC